MHSCSLPVQKKSLYKIKITSKVGKHHQYAKNDLRVCSLSWNQNHSQHKSNEIQKIKYNHTVPKR